MNLQRVHKTVTTLACLVPALGFGQLAWRVVPGTWDGSVELGYDHAIQSREAATTSSNSKSQRYRESVRIANNNFYVFDPRLLIGSLGLQVNLNQGYSNGTTSNTEDQTQVIGYNFDTTALKDKPYVGHFFANRTQGENTQSFGGTVDSTREARGIKLELHEDSILNDKGFPWFKAELTAQQDHNQSTTTFFERVTQQEERNRQVNFIAQKGYTTADLSVRYFLLNNNESAGLIHSVDFGPGLNRTLNSSLDYTKNNGDVKADSLNWSESLSMLHYRNLSSNYAYAFNRQQYGDLLSHEHTASAGLTHELYTNLTSNVTVNGSQLVVNGGTVTSGGAHVSQSYSHSLPREGALNLNWSGGYDLTTNNLTINTIHVFAEKHVAPDIFGGGIGFLLDKAYPKASSVEVFNIQSGTAVRLFEGIDYNLVVLGERIRIEPIFKNPITKTIDPQDVLEVRYDYQLDPKLKYETRSLGFGTLVKYGWITGSYNHNQSQNNLLEGSGFQVHSLKSDSVGVTLSKTLYELPMSLGFQHSLTRDTPLSGDMTLASHTVTDNVTYQVGGIEFADLQANAIASHTRITKFESLSQVQETQTELELDGQWRDIAGSAKATFNQYTSGVLAYQRRALVSSAIWQYGYDLRLVANLSANDTQYTLNNLSDSTRAARVAASWSHPFGWTNEAFAEVRLHTDSRAGSETILQIGGKTSLTIGKLSFSGAASYDQWNRGSSRSKGIRLNASAIRSF